MSLGLNELYIQDRPVTDATDYFDDDGYLSMILSGPWCSWSVKIRQIYNQQAHLSCSIDISKLINRFHSECHVRNTHNSSPLPSLSSSSSSLSSSSSSSSSSRRCHGIIAMVAIDSQKENKQRVLMHRHQGWNVRHGLCHIYMRYLYIYELFIAFVCFVVCSLL